VKLSARARLRGVRARLRMLTSARREPIVVFQMGKVGSRTVYRSLRSLGLPRPMHHVHVLNELDVLEERVRRLYPNPVGTLAEIDKGRALRRRIQRSRGTHWHVITLVRDPVQRDVSSFFHNLTEVIPDVYERHARDEITLTELRCAFLDRYDHDSPLGWFETQLEPVFGIDVFAEPFDTDAGCATYQSPTAKLLVIRLENLGTHGKEAIREFLGLDEFELVRANLARNKQYGNLYAAFGRSVTLPASYLARMYDSRIARHFYTDSEIEAFKERWTKARR
jgi:hypothetical protein